MRTTLTGLAAAILALLLAASPAAAQTKVKIGVLNDQSGPYSDASGPGSVIAAQMAADE